MSEHDEQEEAPDAADPIDSFFSALKHFARAAEKPGASRSGGAAGGTGAPAARFGAAVKKSCCLARRTAK